MRLVCHGLHPNARPYSSASQNEWKAGEEREVEDVEARGLLDDFPGVFETSSKAVVSKPEKAEAEDGDGKPAQVWAEPKPIGKVTGEGRDAKPKTTAKTTKKGGKARSKG